MRPKLKLTLLVLLLLLALVMGTTVLAQTSAGFNLEWYVIGSGGGESSSGTYRVNGTLGHSFTSQPTSGSASFTVSSGYWFFDTGPPGAAGTASYLPVIFKN